MTRIALIAITLALLLAGCGPDRGDATACKAALKTAIAKAVADGGKASDAGRPQGCAGLSDAQQKQIAGEVVAEAFASTTTTEATAGDTTTEAAETTTTTEDAPVTHRLGDTAEIGAADGSFAGTVTVTAVTTRKKTNGMFGKRPKFGRYVEVTISAKGTSGEFSINPYDFYLASADGTRYGYAEGNSFTEDTANPLHDADLKPGEKVKGRLVFDASPQATTLGYAPSLGSDTVATWSLTK